LRSISRRVDRAARAASAAALACSLTAPSAALELALVPAWEGNYRPGASTEVLARVTSPAGGELVVSAIDATTTLTVRRHIEPNTAVEIALAIQPSANAVSVRARLGYGEPVEQSVQLVPLDRPLLPVVADGRDDLAAWLAPAGRYVTQPVAAQSLPRTAAGYGAIAAIVLAGDTLQRLAPDQRDALRAHVATCGRVLMPSAADATAAELAALSACGDRFVSSAADPATLATALAARLAPLPTYEQLLPLDSEPPQLWSLVVWLFAGYLVLLAALAVPRGAAGARGTALLLAAPVLTALLMLAAWWQNAPERRAILWAEQESGAATARYRLLYGVHSRGTTQLALEVPAGLGLPEPLFEQHAEVDHADGATRLVLEPRLLSRASFGFGGTFAHEARFALERDADGPRVTYRGAGVSAPAVLVRGSRYYAVPALASGESWRPAADAPALPRPGLPAAFPPRGTDALLLEVPLESLLANVPPLDSAHAWLALHFPPDGGAP
jgi:hypothetical protein